MERIYLDNAATTRVRPEVAAEVLPIMTEVFGNASSVHAFGREGKKALEKARVQVANAIGAKKEEIYFTAGGSEADNWALKGAAAQLKGKGSQGCGCSAQGQGQPHHHHPDRASRHPAYLQGAGKGRL